MRAYRQPLRKERVSRPPVEDDRISLELPLPLPIRRVPAEAEQEERERGVWILDLG